MISIDFTALIFAISFVLFIGLMYIFFFQPVQRILEQREGSVSGNKDASSSLYQQIDEKTKLLKSDPEILESRKEASEIIAKAKQEASQARQSFLDESNAELKAKRERNITALEQEKEATIKNLEAPIKEITTLMVNKLIGVEKNIQIKEEISV